MLDIMMGGLGSGTLASQASQEKSIGKDPKFVYAVRAYTLIITPSVPLSCIHWGTGTETRHGL